VRIQIRPLVSLIWLAALIMAIGGATPASDRRYRTPRLSRHPRSALPREMARHEPFTLPAAVFVLLVIVLAIGIKHSPDKGIIASL